MLKVTRRAPTIDDVKSYWEQSPLLSHEIGDVTPEEHWRLLDEKKRTDIERFAEHYWNFPGSRGRRVLDIGCGPGWLTVNYAAAGAAVSAIDLTQKAVSITRAALNAKKLVADVEVASAESLPFADATFDIVVSSGVLHHTPNLAKAMSEAFRVTVPGGTGLITLYRKGILHRRAVFPLVRLVMKATHTKHPGADLGRSAASVDDFIRMYDGEDNPVGVGYTSREWQEQLEALGWVIESRESHYFPLRMVPAMRRAPRWWHHFMDTTFGTMVYFTLRRPD